MSKASQLEHFKIAQNAVIQVFGRIIFLLLSLINIKLITNYLSPSSFGEYSTILTFTGFFTVLVDLGLFTVAVREIALKPKDAQKIMSNSLSLRIITALIATSLVVILGYSLPSYSHLGSGILIAAIAMLVYFLSNILDVVFHVNLKMGYISLAENISKISTLLAVFFAVIYDLGLPGIIGAILFGSLVAIIPRVILARNYIKLKLEFDPKVWWWLLKLALPLGIVFILNNIYFKIDSQILYLLAGSYDAGLYGLVYRIMETTIFIAAFVTASITPSLSRAIYHDRATANLLVSRSLEILIAASLLLFLFIASFSEQIILFLSDSSYLAATKVMPILAGVAALIYLNSLFGTILIAADKRKIMVIFAIILVLFNIWLNLLLIPVYGFIGAAWSTLISEIAVLGFNLFATKNLITFKLNSYYLLIILLASFLSLLIFIVFSQYAHWLIASIAGLIVYFAVIFKSKVLSWQIIKNTLRGR